MLKKIVLVSLVSTLFSFHSLISEDILNPGEIQEKVPKEKLPAKPPVKKPVKQRAKPQVQPQMNPELLIDFAPESIPQKARVVAPRATPREISRETPEGTPKVAPPAAPTPSNRKLRFGLEGGANVNYFSQDISWDAGTTTLPNGIKRSTLYEPTAEAKGYSPSFGILTDFSFDNYSAFQVRFGYETKNYLSKGLVQDIDNMGDLVPVEAEFFDYTNWVSAAINYRLRLYNGLFAITGLQLDFLLPQSELEHRITTQDPNHSVTSLRQVINAQNNPKYSVCFCDRQIVKIKGKYPTEDVFDMRAGMNLGLGYEIELNDKLSIVPQARFQYFITPPMKDHHIDDIIAGTTLPIRTEFNNKRLHTLQLLLSLWFTY